MKFAENEGRWSEAVTWMSEVDPTDGQIVYFIPKRIGYVKPYLGCLQVSDGVARVRVLGDVQYDAQRQLNPPDTNVKWSPVNDRHEDVYAIPRDPITDLLIKTIVAACAEADKVRFLREFFADFQKEKDLSV